MHVCCCVSAKCWYESRLMINCGCKSVRRSKMLIEISQTKEYKFIFPATRTAPLCELLIIANLRKPDESCQNTESKQFMMKAIPRATLILSRMKNCNLAQQKIKSAGWQWENKCVVVCQCCILCKGVLYVEVQRMLLKRALLTKGYM